MKDLEFEQYIPDPNEVHACCYGMAVAGNQHSQDCETQRFVLVYLNDPRVPEGYRNDFGSAIIDTMTNEFVACDGGEPEDQLLTRDWSWVVPLLNKIAAGG